MQQLKKAALCLHGLHKDDRESMLNKFPEEKVKQLNMLLANLSSMNMPKAPDIIPTFEDCIAELYDKSDSHIDALKQLIKQIDQASIEEVKGVLSHENNMYVTIILSIHDWEWKAEFLKLLGARERNEINGLLSKVNTEYAERMKYSIVNSFNVALSNRVDFKPDSKSLESKGIIKRILGVMK